MIKIRSKKQRIITVKEEKSQIKFKTGTIGLKYDIKIFNKKNK